MAGNNIAQNGKIELPYAITDKGSVGLYVKEEKGLLNDLLLGSFNRMKNANQNGDPFRDKDLTRDAQPTRDVQIRDREIKIPWPLPSSDRLGHEQQTFFVH